MSVRSSRITCVRLSWTAVAAVLVLTNVVHCHAAALVPPAHGLFLKAMDSSVKPCDDFYQYANGSWLDTVVIPSDHAGVGMFDQIYENNQAVLHRIAVAAEMDRKASPNSIIGKVGSFYRSGMDTARIEKDGVSPLAGEFKRINSVHDPVSLMEEIAHLNRLGVDAGFGLGVEQDLKQSTHQIAALYQGGIHLPERGYYERTDKETQAIRSAYGDHIAKMMELLGKSEGASRSDANVIMTMESRMAHSSLYPVDQRDPHAEYHLMTLVQLNRLTPGVDWKYFFNAVGLKSPGHFNVTQPRFIATVGQMLTSVPLPQWKTYLKWCLVNGFAYALNSGIVNENFHFNSTVMRGVPTNRARWKRVLSATDGALGEALGELYVKAEFPASAKARALKMVLNLKRTLREDIKTLPWMQASTKIQALRKLDAMNIKIGYPNKWRDYSKLDVSSTSYVVNEMHSNEFEFDRQLSKIGKPVDRGEWGMSPSTVNAYYSSSMNEIVFPAGILQPPFFDVNVDDALNYGAIGAVIGHEMTHGFDDQGRQYDEKGNLRNWWTPADLRNFTERGQSIVKQYSAYEVLPGAFINGKLTEGENIADIGGLKIAYLAFQKSPESKLKRLMDGFTPDQRFFLAFGQMWRGKNRPESLKVRLATDPHSPEKFRVLGATTDIPEFRKAFHCHGAAKTPPTVIW